MIRVDELASATGTILILFVVVIISSCRSGEILPSSPTLVGTDLLTASLTPSPTKAPTVAPTEEPTAASPIGEPASIGQSDDSVDAVFIQGNYAYINTGPMLTILDITDPLHPAPVGSTELPETEGPGFPRAFVSDIYVADGYAYVAAYESGLRIFDVSDPTAPIEVGFYQPPLQNWNDFPSIQSPDPPRHMFREGARGVVVRGEATGQTYAYVAAYAAGLRVVDVSDPTTPIEVGIYEYELPAAPTAVTVRDNYAYVAAGRGGLRVMDISDPTALVEISASTTESNWSWDVEVADRDSSRLAYLAEGYCDGMWGCHGGLHVVDVSSPDSPAQIVPASTSGGLSVVITLAEDYAYLTGWHTLRVINLSEPTHTVGRWSTKPTSILIKDAAVVDGYAYLAAGLEGLQVLPISNLSTPSETKSGTGGPEHSPWMTYTSADEFGGQFSIEYPADYELIHEVPSVDGIWTTMTNTVTIFSISPAFALSIEYNPIEAGTSLAQFVDQKSQCVEISAEQGQPFTLGGQEALIFVDTNCGPAGSTEIYTLHNDFGYRVWVQSSAKYEQIKEHIEPILFTFKSTSPPRTPTPAPAGSGPGYENGELNRPFPTSTASASLVASTSTPTPTRVSRRIPLRRSGSNITGSEGQSLYHLVKEEEIQGNVIAKTLSEDEMICIQHFDLTPTQCICWIGPLENAGVRGAGNRGMRRIVILSGSAEEAALALINDWEVDLRAAGKREPCTTEHLTVSFDGGLFKPEPYYDTVNSVTPVPAPPALTPTTPLPTPTWTPEASGCTWEEVPPQLFEVQPAQVAPGDEITVIGSGGYLRDNCGGYNESARDFQLYFDGEPVGVLSCYVNHCEASLTTPANASPGVHCISVAEVGCEIEIQVSG